MVAELSTNKLITLIEKAIGDHVGISTNTGYCRHHKVVDLHVTEKAWKERPERRWQILVREINEGTMTLLEAELEENDESEEEQE